MPKRWAYMPVMRQQRLGEQGGLVMYDIVHLTPCLARESIFGVGIRLFPKQPTSPKPRSSMNRITTFGFFLVSA